MTEISIRRLQPGQASAIAACFRRVYGESYANELFYDVAALAAELESGRLCSVGALDRQGSVLGHMAMVCPRDAQFAELGNTVVDPAARGSGVAWQVGSELSAWCIEKGYPAYLHYPTTDHHIMQRRSVQTGFETGLMLGYIPAETDGQVNPDKPVRRGAATIVLNPLGPCPVENVYFPNSYESLLKTLVIASGLERRRLPGGTPDPGESQTIFVSYPKRALARLEISIVGADIAFQVERLLDENKPCLQLDFAMSDPGIEVGVGVAQDKGFVFCGWLPGYRASDVFRLQRVDAAITDLHPKVVNPRAAELLAVCRGEMAARSQIDSAQEE